MRYLAFLMLVTAACSASVPAAPGTSSPTAPPLITVAAVPSPSPLPAVTALTTAVPAATTAAPTPRPTPAPVFTAPPAARVGATFSGRVSDVFFGSVRNGWALGRVETFGDLPNCQHAGSRCDDVIVATIDGGKTWKIQYSVYTTGVTGFTFHGLGFVDLKHGWTAQLPDWCDPAPCRAGLLATDDGGLTWSVRSAAPQGGVFDAFRFVTATRGWAIETEWWTAIDSPRMRALLLATTDGGSTWTVITDGLGLIPCAGGHFDPPTFADASVGTMKTYVRGAEVVLATTDGGKTWTCPR